MPRAATLAVLIAFVGPCVAMASEDRYGPPRPLDSGMAGYGPTAAPAPGWLNWSRKSAAPAQAPETPPAERPAPQTFDPAPTPFARPDRVASAALPTSLYSAYPAARAEPAPPATLPPARWTPTPTAAPVAGQPPHRYSVAREFGLSPDPIPLPQQFFADGSPDLAAAPPPLPPKPVPGTQAATSAANTASNRARQVALETADSAN